MKRLLVPTALALALGLTGTAWADCAGHQKQTTAEAPVEKPVPSPSS